MSGTSIKLLKRQRGVALLILFTLLFLVGASLFITVVSNNVVDEQRNEAIMDAMALAKERLISYAVLQGDYYGTNGAGPGHLMCPDTDGDGVEDTPCGVNALGRLPVSVTLPSGDVFPLSDYNSGLDQQFWYALSNEVRRSPAGIVNTTTASGLSVDGQGGVAAVLIAPGELITAQTRPTNAAADYLEAANTTAPNFVTSNPASPTTFNDRVLAITSAEMISAVAAKVAEALKFQLEAYRQVRGRYPRRQRDFDNMLQGDTGGRRGRGRIAPMPGWFFNNNWDAISNYNRTGWDSGTVNFDGCNITFSMDRRTAGVAKDQSQC